MELRPGQRLVFIAGLHRSGTSLLFRCLREHPAISGFRNTNVPEDEGQHLQRVFPAARAHGGPGKFGFAPEAALDEHSSLVSPHSRRSLLQSWGPHWDLTRPLLLEKSPPNLIRMRFLQALFPEAHFIVMVRHPLAVALATRKWSHTSIESLVEHWLVCHERMRRDQASLRSLTLVRYEQFVEHPQRWLDALYAWLGLPTHENRLAVHRGSDDKYAAAWQEHLATSTGATEAMRVRAAYGQRVTDFGYSLSEFSASAAHRSA